MTDWKSIADRLAKALDSRAHCTCEFKRAGSVPVWENGQRILLKQCSACAALNAYKEAIDNEQTEGKAES